MVRWKGGGRGNLKLDYGLGRRTDGEEERRVEGRYSPMSGHGDFGDGGGVGGIIMVARGQKAQGTPETADAIGYVRSE